MSIQTAILGFLMEGALSGYDIKTRFESSVSHFFEASFGGIYPALHRMERDGLVTKDVIAQDGRPNKNLFAVTEAGRHAFHLELKSALQPESIRSDFLLRVFFGRYATREQFIRWLEEERDRVVEKLRKLSELGAQCPAMEPYERKTLEYGLSQYEAQLRWVNQEIDQARGGKNG
ncbi:MAG: PadR family transcriptional regulator [Bacilli bacterium]